MPPDETLSAVISATDDVSQTLERVAESFQDIAESATAAGSAARNAADGFDEAEDEGSALNRALNSVSQSGTTAAGGMGAASTAAEGVESSFDEAEDEVSDFNSELREAIITSGAAGAGISTMADRVDNAQTSLDDPFGLEEEETAARRVIDRLETGRDVVEKQERISWFSDPGGQFTEAKNEIEQRADSQLPIDADVFGDATSSAHLRSEGFESVDETLRRIGQRHRALDKEIEMEGEMDVDDRPLSRVENTLVRVGDRMGVLDRSSFEAEGEVDFDDSPLNRAIRSIGDVERGVREVDGKEFEVEGEVEIDENRFQRLGNRLGGRFGDSFSDTAGSATDRALRRVIDTFDADIEHPAETQKDLHGLGRSMQGLPDFEYEEEDLDVFAQKLQTGVRGSNELADVMEDIGDDDIIGEATGLDDLTHRMREAGYETRNARQAIDRMEGSGRALSDQLVADATGVKMYRNQVDELGDEALDTSVRIDKLSSEARELAGSAAVSAASVLGLGEAIEEAGDEAGGAVAKVAAFDAAVQRIGPNLSDVSTSFAGFRTSLGSLAKMAPMMMSLASALGAVATAGASAAGGLGFIMAGGLLGAGQQRGEALASTPGDPEEMEGAMKDAHEASSDLGRSMAGIQDIMSDLKQAAFEAMAPLRTPEFADFSLWVLENAVTLLHEVAQGVAAMGDHFMEFARVAADSFWTTFPKVVHQLNMIVAEFLTGDLTTAVIESIPGILESFRTEGRELIPMISEMISEWVKALPSLMRLGTAMVKFLIPALTGLAKGLNLVSPLTIFAAEVLTMMADALGPVIEGFFGLMGIIYGASMTLTTATAAMVGLLAIFTGALAIIAGWVLLFTKLATAALWLGKAIVTIVTFLTGLTATVVTAVGILAGLAAVIVGLLTYFDLWDEALVGLARTWNWFIDLFNMGADFITEGIEGMANDAIRALNKIAKYIPGVDQLEEVEFDGSDTFSQHKVSEERAREIGEKANLGERAEGGIENPADDLKPTPDTDSAGGGRGSTQGHPNRQGSAQGMPQNTGSHIETMNVFSSPETDDEELRRAAREAVKQANKRERRTNSSLN